MEIRNAHGKEEVSCMALDVHQRRLISAATNGTIKASRDTLIIAKSLTRVISLRFEVLPLLGAKYFSETYLLVSYCSPIQLFVLLSV